MSKIVIRQKGPLKGMIPVSGSKNAVLPILCAAILTDEPCTIQNVPDLKDVSSLLELIGHLGGSYTFRDHTVKLSMKNVRTEIAPYELVNKLRGSFLIAGALLARSGHARVSLPGGCNIGNRPIDLHLKGFSALGATIDQEHGVVDISCKGAVGNKIYLDFPSVGATENLLLASVLAKGETILENAAAEPEIVDLANFLNQMGASVEGAGTDTLYIQGVSKLHGATHQVIPDRIEAGTFMVAAAATKGSLTLNHVIPDHLKPITAKLREIGVRVEEAKDSLTVEASEEFHPIDIKTLPFPGFPTDMQAQFMSLMSLVKGTSVFTETIFENRYLHVPELKRMGANIKVDGRTAVVEGASSLTGATVAATDLRAGAALVIAGLAAEGETTLTSVSHIDRGYEKFEEKLCAVGADIQRIEEAGKDA